MANAKEHDADEGYDALAEWFRSNLMMIVNQAYENDLDEAFILGQLTIAQHVITTSMFAYGLQRLRSAKGEELETALSALRAALGANEHH